MKKFLLLLLLLSVCVNAEAASFREELLRLDGVVSVDVIVQSPDKSGDVAFKEKYIAWFEQPIDWDNPNAGKFVQRAEIGFQGWDNVNVAYVGGYNLSDKSFPVDDRVELARMYDANFINMEYRYYGLSMPEGLSDDVPAMWEHLTNKNAAADFHNIMEQLRGILSGNWAFTGISKGGQTTNIFAYYYPKDADVYVPYVAPFCDTPEDPRLMDAVFTTIGNERYGAVQAKAYRDLMMEFLVELVRERDYIQPRYNNLISDDVPYGSEDIYVSMDVVASGDADFEMAIIDVPVGIWQYDGNFARFDKVLNMPERNAAASSDRVPYLREMLRLLRDTDDDATNDENEAPRVGESYAYMVQVEKENGAYLARLQYLREALKSEGLEMSATDEYATGYNARTSIKPNLLAALSYDRSLRDNVINWLRATDAKIIMVYGNSDPWYFVRIADDVTADNPNVTRIAVNYGHGAEIAMLESEDKAAFTAVIESLDVLLESEYDNADNTGQENTQNQTNNQTQTDNQSQQNGGNTSNDIQGVRSSSGSCNFSGTGALMLSALFVLIRRKKS